MIDEITDRDTDAVARTIYGEARNQGELGLQAVANVIMNRVEKQIWYGLTPYDVCMKSEQFSCWDKYDPNRAVILAVTTDDPIFAECMQIAFRAVTYQLPDITVDALNYRRVGTPASWDPNNSLIPCKVIGEHEFFNNVS